MPAEREKRSSDSRGARSVVPAADPALRHLEDLRARRARRATERSIGDLIAPWQRESARHARKGPDVAGAWIRALPEALVAQTAIEGFRAGVISVLATSSAVAYEIDRHLRSGALGALRTELNQPLLRVKVRLGGG